MSLAAFTSAQPVFTWDKIYGGESWEELNGLLTLKDGYLVGASSQSAYITGFVADTVPDFHLLRTDFDGNELWSKSFGGRKEERLWSLIQTQDGNFLMGGFSESDLSPTKSQPNLGESDYYLVKVDEDGNLLWDRTFGGSKTDQIFAMKELANGNVLVIGNSNSDASTDKTDNCLGGLDMWMLMLDANGNKVWDKTIGGDTTEFAYDLLISPDQRYAFISGGTSSLPNTGTIGSDPKRGKMDFWFLKFDLQDQTIVWSHRYGGAPSSNSFVYRSMKSYDGNYILVGQSSGGIAGTSVSNVNNGKASEGYGDLDYWMIKVDPNGKKLVGFDKTIGGSGLDVCYDIYENFFGDLILGGVSDSPIGGSKVAPHLGNYDIWLVSLDRNWNVRWQKSLGGDKSDSMTRITVDDNGSYVIGGHSASDRSSTKSDDSQGRNDIWLIKSSCDFYESITQAGVTDPCLGETMTLQAGSDICSDCVYFWSNGHAGASLEVPPGTNDTLQLLVARKNDGCLSRDTIPVNNPLPVNIDLGPRDSSLVTGQSITIGGNNPELQFMWNTGDTTASIVVSYEGVFAVTVTDANGCTATDWMRVYQGDKEAVYIPNVFSPNSDGLNDYFNVYGDASVRRVLRLDVYDRWGELMFTKSDYVPNYEIDGWNGTFRDRSLLPAAFIYFVEVEFIDQTKKEYTGTVAIVR
jgi:gliding motility-associated-like protein